MDNLGRHESGHIEEYDVSEEVKQRELQLKVWAREKKEKLINGEWTKW